MKKLLMLLAILSCAPMVSAMDRPAQRPIALGGKYQENDVRLVQAIIAGQTDEIGRLIALGVNLDHLQETLHRDQSALLVAFEKAPKEKKAQIFEILLAAGAQPQALSHILVSHANGGDVAAVQELCELGVKDDGQALAEAQSMEQASRPRDRKSFQKIIELLSQCQGKKETL